MNPSVEELQGMLASRDRFFATVLHELRNPLAPIVNAVEVLTKCGDDRPNVSGAHGVIQRQLKLLTRLVEDLANTAQVVRGHVVLQWETVDLVEVVALAVETARPLIESRGHELKIQTPCERIVLQADSMRLAQVIANLLINAAKYTRCGGRIEVAGEHVRDKAVVCVRDNGMGIEPEMAERIFEPFIQVARSSLSKGGLGMGLAVARQLIELHGGSISVQSGGTDCGSEFTVALPLRQVQTQKEAVTKRRAPP